jgi:hypothetical protein
LSPQSDFKILGGGGNNRLHPGFIAYANFGTG